MYVLENSEPGLFTVGYFDPRGMWRPHCDVSQREYGERMVNYLNGGNGFPFSLKGKIDPPTRPPELFTDLD